MAIPATGISKIYAERASGSENATVAQTFDQKVAFHPRMKNHFPGLAALRAIAALVVVLSHVELLKHRGGIPNILGNLTFWPDGHLAVILFFVLSGFLISHILVQERQATGKIAFRSFYMRRILRIWPVYYMTIILSALLVPAEYEPISVVLTLTIFPNLAHALDMAWPSSPQLWSIGVEEQFYLALPFVVSRVALSRLPLLLILFFVGWSALPHVIGMVNSRTLESDAIEVVYRFFYGSKFNSMSVGCLLGTLVASEDQAGARKANPFLRFLRINWIAYAAILMSFGFWMCHLSFGYFTDEVYAVLFGVMILNVATNLRLKLNLEREPFTFVGKISYGIYMYHWMVIVLTMKVITPHDFQSALLYNVCLYGAVLMTTAAASWISFLTLEQYFLRKKSLFDRLTP